MAAISWPFTNFERINVLLKLIWGLARLRRGQNGPWGLENPIRATNKGQKWVNMYVWMEITEKLSQEDQMEGFYPLEKIHNFKIKIYCTNKTNISWSTRNDLNPDAWE